MNGIYGNIKERVLYFAENVEKSKQKFFRNVGLQYQNYTGKSAESDLGSKAIAKIVSKYPDVDLHWLITGKKKFDVNTSTSQVEEPGVIYGEDYKKYKVMYFEVLEKYMRINEEKEALKRALENLRHRR